MLAADVVVVGAGLAGCVMARRLAASGRSVILVEAGSGRKLPPELRRLDIGALGSLTPQSELAAGRVWPNVVAMGQGGEKTLYTQGRGLGGSSALNGGVLAAPTKDEIDLWQNDLGCLGWDHENLAPWIDRTVKRLRAGQMVRSPVGDLIDEWAGRLGLNVGPTSLDDNALGSIVPVVAARIENRDLIRALPSDPIEAGGLKIHLLSETVADRVEFPPGSRAGRAVNLRLVDGRSVSADQFVLCGGALRSPLLAARSGLLGDTPSKLELLDHRSVAITFPWPHAHPIQDGYTPALVHRIWRWTPSALTDHQQPGQAIAHFVGPFGDSSVASDRYGVALISSVESLRRVAELGSGRADADVVLRDCLDGDPVAPSPALVSLSSAVRELSVTLMAELAATGKTSGGATSAARFAEADVAELHRLIRASPGPTYHVAASLPLSPPAVLAAGGAHGVRCDLGQAGRLPSTDNVSVVDASILPGLPAIGPQLTIMAVADRICSETFACP